MRAVVVDTNVAKVANGEASQANKKCVGACLDVLDNITRGGLVVVDDDFRIIKEYLRNLTLSGQLRPGSAFLKWVLTNRTNSNRCECVHITPKVGENDDFVEFPDSPDLAGFDRADRKFVAVAINSRNSPSILNATDRGWWHYKEALDKHSVRVEFLCPALMTRRK